MSKQIITLDAKLLAATMESIGDDPTRYYLEGVQIERGDSCVLAIATCGALLTCTRHVGEYGLLENSVMLAVKGSKGFMSDVRNVKAYRVVLEWQQGKFVYSVENEHGGILGTGFVGVIDGSFPDWRRIVSVGNKPIESRAWGPLLLEKLVKIGKRLGTSKKPMPFRVFGGEPAFIRYKRDDIFSLAMPLVGKSVQVEKEVPFNI